MNFSKTIALFTALMFSVGLPAAASAASFQAGGVRMNKAVTPLKEIKHRNIVNQSLDFSCGPAGLSTLLNYFLNDRVTETDIINYLLQTTPLEKVKERRGFSLLDLKNFAKAKGYKVTGYKMDLDFLRKLGKPVLVPIKFKNYRHFVIVKGVMADRVFIADPAAGNLSLKADKFQNMWLDGIGLVIEKKGKKQQNDYALKVKKEDFVVADYKVMRRLIEPGRILPTVFTNEF